MPGKSPFTKAREELISRMKGDSRFTDVSHWYEFSEGLTERFDVQPSDCPYVAIFPQETDEGQPSNAQSEIPQGLTIEIGTAGQDVQPLERLEWDWLKFLRDDVRDDHLGLASDGLTAINITGGSWGLFPGESAAQPKWVVSNELTLVWRVF
jgi:hypothetical protein